MPSPFKSCYVAFVLLCLVTIFLPAHADCNEEAIARLTDFTGTVLIKSSGEWAIKPEKNFPLYCHDKVVTRIGTATVTFSDGATIDIKNNSNLFIDERKTETGLTKKVKMVERRIILFLGKMFFKTGTGQVQTQFLTEKTVIGIRGTAGILSIGPDGEVYITFTEGGATKVIGDVISGVAKPLAKEEADKHPIQQAAYLAYDWHQRCLEAKREAAEGKIPTVQALWICSKARAETVKELMICAEYMVAGTPLFKEREYWAEIKEDQAEKFENEIKNMEDFIDQGAIPIRLEYRPPGEETLTGEGFSEERPIVLEPLESKPEHPTAGNEEEIPIDDSEPVCDQATR